MTKVPETTYTTTARVWCDGAGDIRSTGGFSASALGHPRVWLEIDERVMPSAVIATVASC
jgi:uncharacterized Zn-finger protein